MAALAALVAMPAAAHAQHSKLSLESIGPAGGNGAAPADVVGTQDSGQAGLHDDRRAPHRGRHRLVAGPLLADRRRDDAAVHRHRGRQRGVPGELRGSARQSGTRVFFQTDEKLVTADTDSSLDVYMRESGTTTLVSTGPGAGANGAFDSLFAAASTDGSRVFFITRGALVGGDTDAALRRLRAVGRQHVARLDRSGRRERAARSRAGWHQRRRHQGLLPRRPSPWSRRTPTACRTSTSARAA